MAKNTINVFNTFYNTSANLSDSADFLHQHTSSILKWR